MAQATLDWAIDADTHITEPLDIYCFGYGNGFDAGLRDAKPEVRRKLLFDNAARLYGVEAPDRAPSAAA